MRRVRNTLKELNPGWHWKLKCPNSKNNVKISIENRFFCFRQIDISDIKPVERCEVRS